MSGFEFESALAMTLLIFGVIMLVASLDDLIIDVLSAFRLRGKQLPALPAKRDEQSLLAAPSVAVFVANWHEADVLGAMVDRNLRNFTYPRVKFVLGVYPNDTETKSVALQLAQKHPEHVQVVVNRRSGPTSKGQMLNEMFAQVFAKREAAPDLVVMHDSEDVIAPRSFEVYAREAQNHAMIQIPIFSLDSRHRSLIGATYMEEFAERHTLELRLRELLGAFVPSAGVGTCLRKDLICHFINSRGYVLQPGSVTEDYILGAEAHRAGFSTRFAAYRNGEDAKGSLIATLEYFPKDFWASVRQRTRWTYGIGFEGAKRLGWFGSAWNRFFLYRDRKGVVANILPLVSLALLLVCLLAGPDPSGLSDWQRRLLLVVLGINSASIAIRILQKAAALRRVYGFFDLLGLVARWPIAMLINAIAVARAWRSFIVESALASKPVVWAKTKHELPENFAVANAGTQASTAIPGPGLPGHRAQASLRIQTLAGGSVALACMVVLIAGGLKIADVAPNSVFRAVNPEAAVLDEQASRIANQTALALAELSLGTSEAAERTIMLSAAAPTEAEVEIMIAEAATETTADEPPGDKAADPPLTVAVDDVVAGKTAAAMAEFSLRASEATERAIVLSAKAPTDAEVEIMIAEAATADAAADQSAAEAVQDTPVTVAIDDAASGQAAVLAEVSISNAATAERDVRARMLTAPAGGDALMTVVASTEQDPSRLDQDERLAATILSGDDRRDLAEIERERPDIVTAARAAMAESQAAEQAVVRLAKSSDQSVSTVETGSLQNPSPAGVVARPQPPSMPQSDDVLAGTELTGLVAKTADNDIPFRTASADVGTEQSEIDGAPKKSAAVSASARKRVVEAKNTRKHQKKWRSTEKKQLKALRSKNAASAASKKSVKLATKIVKARPSTFLRKRCRDPSCGVAAGPVSSLPVTWQDG